MQDLLGKRRDELQLTGSPARSILWDGTVISM